MAAANANASMTSSIKPAFMFPARTNGQQQQQHQSYQQAQHAQQYQQYAQPPLQHHQQPSQQMQTQLPYRQFQQHDRYNGHHAVQDTTPSTSGSNSNSAAFISHSPQVSVALSRKSSGSSGDPFAYDRASLLPRGRRSSLIHLQSSLGSNNNSGGSAYSGANLTRHTPTPSLASTKDEHANGEHAGVHKNKELPPQPPAGSPVDEAFVDAPSPSFAQSAAFASSQQREHQQQQQQYSAEPQSAGLASPTPAPNVPLPPTPVPVEYVQALHDYVTAPESANVCLSFNAGDLIKVLNKDPSGWWDGEINGTRGWFPSNYVLTDPQEAVYSPSYAIQDTSNDSFASACSEPMRRAATTPLSASSGGSISMSSRSASLHPIRPDSSAFDPTRRPSSQDTVTSAVTHAIALMQSAVDANRLSHFRPASSCFVVAVKSILHATDTLAKDSVVLRTHLVLARERKQILSNLASVMTLARSASNPQLDTMARAQETGLMVQTAHMALSNVEHFLQTAMQCGVDVPARIDASIDQDDRQAVRITNLQNVSTPNLDACLQFPLSADAEEMAMLSTSTTPRMPSGILSHKSSASSSSGRSLHKARSFSDVRAAGKRKMSAASNTSSNGGTSNSSHGVPSAPQNTQQYAFLSRPPTPNDAHPPRPSHQMLRRPSIPAAYATSTANSPAWQPNDSISSSTSSLNSSQGPPTPLGDNEPQQPMEVYRVLQAIHDQFISTIAAFLGHGHAHSRTSHSSSYVHLIDMTRVSINGVRDILLIVDVVAKHPALAAFEQDLERLGRYREALFVATTSLVTAARKATAPLPAGLADEAAIREQEEDEKQELLKAATGALRASADCVKSTNPLLLRKRTSDDAFVIDLTQVNSSELSRSSSGSTEAPLDEDATVQVPDSGIGSEESTSMGFGNRSGERGRHTISMLTRKATSLACMAEQQHHQHDQGDHSHSADISSDSVEELTSNDEADNSQDSHSMGRPSQARSWTDSDREELQSSQSSRHAPSARSSRQMTRPDTPNDTERSESSLSMRRGLPMPPNLHIQTRPIPPYARPPSFGSMSAASTITSISRDKAGTPAPVPRATPTPTPMSAEPKSASSTSTTSSDASHKAGGEAMSRDESSRGSAASTATSSFRSAFSDSNTADTSPRSSILYSSPADEKIDWLSQDPATLGNGRKVSRHEQYRARSGSTPDRLAALRVSELGVPSQLLSPLSPRSPHVSQEPGTSGKKNWLLERDYEPKECSFNSDGNVTGGTLRCLVERMTLHDQTIDASFSNTFFLTFRMFTTPISLTDLLIERFHINPPASLGPSEIEHKIWRDQKLTPVRLRIYNFFKTWLESHWRPETDGIILDRLLAFTRETMMPAMPSAAQRLVDLVHKRGIVTQSSEHSKPRTLTRMASTDKLKAGKPINDGIALGSATFPGPGSSLPPAPIMSKSLLNSLRTPPFAPNTILDFDPLELARQFTIMESKLYCCIQPEDLIGQEYGKKGTTRSTNVRAMSSLSTCITGWIAEIILSEQDAKKRSGLVKYFIKLGDRCMLLQNYNTLMAILAALNSSTIARLRKTWDGLSNKHKATLEILRKMTEHTRNYAQYRATIRSAVAPCLPFLGLTLTDLTFCQDGNAPERASPLDGSLKLINFDRYQKIAKIINDVQRFQIPYSLVEVSEIQSFLHNALRNVEHGGDPQALYRRSLMVEPREPANEYQGVPHSAGLKDTTFGWKI